MHRKSRLTHESLGSASHDARSAIARAAKDVQPTDARLMEWYPEYADAHAERLAQDLMLVQCYSAPGATLLEYGSSPPILTTALQRAGYQVTGLDLAPDRFADAIAAQDLNVLRCDVERDPVELANGHADIVLFNEIFEHLRIDPNFTFAEVVRVMSPGAYMLLSTPNLLSFQGLKNLILRRRVMAVGAGIHDEFRKLGTLGHMGHVREYTGTEVIEFLDSAGLTDEKVIHRGLGRGLLSKNINRWIPRSRPFSTYVARKNGA